MIMANSFFRFKQFEIMQSDDAFKVGTDAVICGAWARIGEARRILDVGTGTGVIALMLAQRSDNAEVTGVEFSEKACDIACENVRNSIWNDSVDIVNSSFQTYSSEIEDRFDLIVSNPPYFVNSLKIAK